MSLPIARVTWLAEAGTVAGTVRSLGDSDSDNDGVLVSTECAGEIGVTWKGQKTAVQMERALRVETVELAGDCLDLSRGRWLKHTDKCERGLSALAALCERVRISWGGGISYHTDEGNGLRPAQAGALHAIAAHWSVSSGGGIVVMPTGTGKTEVMLAATVAAKCERVLVVVPSDALRVQTAGKFATLGVLRDFGIVPRGAMLPVVGLLKGVPKTDDDLAVFDVCNVVVSTMAALAGMRAKQAEKVANRCSHLFMDEAHHAPAETWNKLRERFEGKPILQFTATPFRRDGRPLEGRILYQYPLARAQKDGHFQQIQLIEVWEWEQAEADREIARLAVNRLRDDLAKGFDHLLMARADTIERAEQLFGDVYRQDYADLKPIIVHNRTPKRRAILEAIKHREHRVIVCVDMLGEGFDLPQLKIAALHDAHRSLGVTLQFAGRFTRVNREIGPATIVANLADERTADDLEKLYAEDADWNELLPRLSEKAIEPQARLSEWLNEGLESGAPSGEIERLAASSLSPKSTTVMYRTPDFEPDKFRGALRNNEEVVHWWKNMQQRLLAFVVWRREDLSWASARGVVNRIYDLYIAHHDAKTGLLFLHSSYKGARLSKFAEAIGGNKLQRVAGEEIYRAFHGLEELMFYNVGLSRRGPGPVSYQMLAGLNVARAIDPAAADDSTKATLFGAGYEAGERVILGGSRKGVLWSHVGGSVPGWRAWCRHVGAKVVDQSIETDAFLENTLIPRPIERLPTQSPISIEWPGTFFRHTEREHLFLVGNHRASWLDCEIQLVSWGRDSFNFTVTLPPGSRVNLKADLEVGASRFRIAELPRSASKLIIGEEKYPVEEFFAEHPPLLRFADGAEILDHRMVVPRRILLPQIHSRQIIPQSWGNTNFTIESKWKAGVQRQNSIQGWVIDRLMSDPKNILIFDDDDSGEAADVIAMRDSGNCIEVEFFHCKFSSSPSAGSRIGDLLVVCGQAQKSIAWTLDFTRLYRHLLHRQRESCGGRPTRFEHGSLRTLHELRRRIRMVRPVYHITIVQPGVSKAALVNEHSVPLGATSLLIRQRLSTELNVWVSS